MALFLSLQFRMKKIDKLVLNAFIGPFIITLLVVVFILLNINMLRYFDDIIGKGLEYSIIAQLFFYFAIFTIPTALPLAVLLSSLIAFGNLGEHFELTAIKSAGVSLVRIIQPLFLAVCVLTGLAFYANNNLVPHAALEAYSLLYDIKQKKPAMDLREGAFFNGLTDISIKVDKKYPDGVSLKDIILYDHRKNDGNKVVTIADSGRMYTILNERYMMFELYNGYHYEEGNSSEREVTGQRKRNNETVSRSSFSKSQVVFDMSSFGFDRTDKSWFQGNRIMRNINQLDWDIDSIQREINNIEISHYQYRPSLFSYAVKTDSLFMPKHLKEYKKYKDSIAALPPKRPIEESEKLSENTSTKNEKETKNTPQEVSSPAKDAPSLDVKSDSTENGSNNKQWLIEKRKREQAEAKKRKEEDELKKKEAERKRKAEAERKKREAERKKKLAQTKKAEPTEVKPVPEKPVITDSMRIAKTDSVFLAAPDKDMISQTANIARQVKTQLTTFNNNVKTYRAEKVTYIIQWHKIFASSLACLAMFLIGAPLGAIIKKGGLGVPFLISIIFFIIYYVITMQGEKLAKQETVGVVTGIWMADVILFIIGLFFIRQARIDARLFEADFYSVVSDKIKRWLKNRKKVESKPIS
jgi:lipopolysaccharide export system permease protein